MLFILSKITCGDNLCWLFFFFSNIFQPIKSEEHKYCMLKHSILSLCYIVRSSTHDHHFILFTKFIILSIQVFILFCVFTFRVPFCDVRCDSHIKTSLSPVAC
jgi:hypothetical protein